MLACPVKETCITIGVESFTGYWIKGKNSKKRGTHGTS